MLSRERARWAFPASFAVALAASVGAAWFFSRPGADFSAQYQKLGTPKLILFLDSTHRIPVQPVSRLHRVSSTWVYYDPAEERSDYSRSRRQFRLRPNAAVQFRSDREDSELTLLRTGLAKLWGPRVEKDRRGETRYVFVSDALYQQDKEWHEHPDRLFALYVLVAIGISLLTATLIGATATGIAAIASKFGT
jgi:hypothetical protein